MNDRDWNEPDLDWDSPACVEHCACPLCVQSDRDEAALLARVDSTAEELIDLGELELVCRRPWREGAA